MKTAITSAVVAFMSMTAMATGIPDVTGTIVDNNGNPMEFVNVVLLSLPDSTFVQGATSDMDEKCWLKNDALCLRASLYDALQRTSQKIEMDCGYYLLNQHSINNRHRLDVSLRYTFNAQQSKYKGTGAGKEAAERMGK